MNWQIFKLAARNLMRNRRRNIATGSALCFGFAGLLEITGFQRQIESNLQAYTIYGNRVGHIALFKHDGLDNFASSPAEYGFNEKDLQLIKRVTAEIPEIEFEGPQIVGPGLVSNGCQSVPFYALGIDPELDRHIQLHSENLKWNHNLKTLTSGRELWAYSPSEPVIALSSGLAEAVGKLTPRDPEASAASSSEPLDCTSSDLAAKVDGDSVVQLAGQSWGGLMSASEATVVGVYRTHNAYMDSSAARMPLTQMQELYGTKGASSYAIWLKDGEQVAQVIENLRSKFMANGMDLDLYSWNDAKLSPHYYGMSRFIRTVSTFIAAIIALVVALSVSNSASMTIIERSREIGMMRSIGFTRRWIRALFVVEIGTIALFSLIFGCVGAFFFIQILNAIGIPLQLPGVVSGLTVKMLINQWTIGQGGISILLLAVASALYAVWRVAKKNISNLLTGTFS